MLELIADNALLRMLLLALLFALVAAGAILRRPGHRARGSSLAAAWSRTARGSEAGRQTMGSLRTERVESAWLKLVNSIEKSGLSLVDTKDEALRQKLVAAGYHGAFCASRLYACPAGPGDRPAAARACCSSG